MKRNEISDEEVVFLAKRLFFVFFSRRKGKCAEKIVPLWSNTIIVEYFQRNVQF